MTYELITYNLIIYILTYSLSSPDPILNPYTLKFFDHTLVKSVWPDLTGELHTYMTFLLNHSNFIIDTLLVVI